MIFFIDTNFRYFVCRTIYIFIFCVFACSISTARAAPLNSILMCSFVSICNFNLCATPFLSFTDLLHFFLIGGDLFSLPNGFYFDGHWLCFCLYLDYFIAKFIYFGLYILCFLSYHICLTNFIFSLTLANRSTFSYHYFWWLFFPLLFSFSTVTHLSMLAMPLLLAFS